MFYFYCFSLRSFRALALVKTKKSKNFHGVYNSVFGIKLPGIAALNETSKQFLCGFEQKGKNDQVGKS